MHTMSKKSPNSIIEAADLLSATLRKVLALDGGLHAETLIASAARMAGSTAFLSFAAPLGALEPGSVVVTDAGNALGPRLVGTLFATLRSLGHTEVDEARLGGARDTTAGSRLSLAQTQTLLGPWYLKIKEVCGLSYEEMAHAGAVTTAVLIHDCDAVLPVHNGCAIAIDGLVESIKTVPQPFDADA